MATARAAVDKRAVDKQVVDSRVADMTDQVAADNSPVESPSAAAATLAEELPVARQVVRAAEGAEPELPSAMRAAVTEDLAAVGCC